MSFIRKNCTIVVLVAILVSSLSISLLAERTIYDYTDVDGVTVQTKRLVGAYPQAEEMVLDSISETEVHYDNVFLYCTHCGNGGSAYSLEPALDPTRARIVVEFDGECWSRDIFAGQFKICLW